MKIEKLSAEHTEECVDLFINVFTKAPWNDTYRSRKQVVRFFQNHLANNYFVGYILREGSEIIALSLGMKKPWINGMEYYIDQFCVRSDLQGRGIGSYFLKQIEREIQAEKMNAILLNTERGVPADAFYRKNGFQAVDELITFVK